MELAYTSKFISSLKKLLKKNPDIKDKVETALTLLSKEPQNPLLHSHKLKGKLSMKRCVL